MRYHELVQEKVDYEESETIIKAMQPIANQRIVWRGMSGGTAYKKVTNDRTGFYGGIKPEAAAVVRALGIKNPTFGSLNRAKTMQFGSLNVVIPIKPYRALQSEELEDLVYTYAGSAEDIAATYKERMDFDGSEIIFDMPAYYMIDIAHALRILMDPDDFAEHRISGQIQEVIESLKTYQDVIDVLTKEYSY